ncbi:MAG: alpha-D-ribose 1-methylphosphonate 5-triphosphate diphosphatase, partial [Acidimicrobiia bacterium]|nr:alpha-D-ribose 1-methylphosphonate 5-triphosphate diphosphatase [Acidimicrobiia bacterium]
GLRSRATVRELIAALRRRRRTPRVELHVRHERCNTEDADELEEWIRTGAVGLLSFNDHTPGGIATVTGLTREQIERSGVDEATLEELLASAIDRRPTGLEQEPRLAAAAADAGCATASHDSHDDGNLRRDVELGVAIAEFPTSIELAHRYRRAGIDVSLGAPNLVRGGSHLGHMSVRDAVADGAGSLLCSDYHYPSLLHAPFVMSRLGLGSFGAAWTTVSEAPARAVGMADRGRLEPGAQADVVVVEPADDHTPARVRAVVVAGVVAYHAP